MFPVMVENLCRQRGSGWEVISHSRSENQGGQWQWQSPTSRGGDRDSSPLTTLGRERLMADGLNKLSRI